MKERHLKPNEITWNQQKVENHRLNEALFTGWKGSTYYRGVMARVLFRGIINSEPNGEVKTLAQSR